MIEYLNRGTLNERHHKESVRFHTLSLSSSLSNTTKEKSKYYLTISLTSALGKLQDHIKKYGEASSSQT